MSLNAGNSQNVNYSNNTLSWTQSPLLTSKKPPTKHSPQALSIDFSELISISNPPQSPMLTPNKFKRVEKTAKIVWISIQKKRSFNLQAHANDIHQLSCYEQLHLLERSIRFHTDLTVANLSLFDKLTEESLLTEKEAMVVRLSPLIRDEPMLSLIALLPLSETFFDSFVVAWIEKRPSALFLFDYFEFFKARMSSKGFHAMLCLLANKHPTEILHTLLRSRVGDSTYLEKDDLSNVLQECFANKEIAACLNKNEFTYAESDFKVDAEEKRKLYKQFIKIWNYSQHCLKESFQNHSSEELTQEEQQHLKMTFTLLAGQLLKHFSSYHEPDFDISLFEER